MKLPNGNRAELGTKLEDYCLNLSHKQGQHKARLFQTILGTTLANQEVLCHALKDAAADSEDALARGEMASDTSTNYAFPFPPRRVRQ